jgi:hypothetical protein
VLDFLDSSCRHFGRKKLWSQYVYHYAVGQAIRGIDDHLIRLGWQLLWVSGLFIGQRFQEGKAILPASRLLRLLFLISAIAFLAWRWRSGALPTIDGPAVRLVPGMPVDR